MDETPLAVLKALYASFRDYSTNSIDWRDVRAVFRDVEAKIAAFEQRATEPTDPP